MWIVKIGGSLNTNPNLPAWLNLWETLIRPRCELCSPP